VGYGYRSVKHLVDECIGIEASTAGLASEAALDRRRELLAEIDQRGVTATPANSRYNELVIEAGRLSILNGGREAVIDYGAKPSARLREW
jgi:hypothetical protein